MNDPPIKLPAPLTKRKGPPTIKRPPPLTKRKGPPTIKRPAPLTKRKGPPTIKRPAPLTKRKGPPTIKRPNTHKKTQTPYIVSLNSPPIPYGTSLNSSPIPYGTSLNSPPIPYGTSLNSSHIPKSNMNKEILKHMIQGAKENLHTSTHKSENSIKNLIQRVKNAKTQPINTTKKNKTLAQRKAESQTRHAKELDAIPEKQDVEMDRIEMFKRFQLDGNESLKNTSTRRIRPCESTSLHNIDVNIDNINDSICVVNHEYKKILDDFTAEFVSYMKNEPKLTAYKGSLDEWFETFKNIFIWQLFTKSDLRDAIAYEKLRRGEDAQISNANSHKVIQNLNEKYIFKLITAYYTTACISYSVLNYRNVYHKRYTYLENLLGVLNCAVTSVNIEFNHLWPHFLGRVPRNNASYVLSGGNIFFLFAGILCYYNEKNRPKHPLLSSIAKEIDGLKNIDRFRVVLAKLFKTNLFNEVVADILSNMSDIDLLFLTPTIYVDKKEEEVELSKISALSAAVLRKILKVAHDTPKPAKKGEKNTSYTEHYRKIFPFIKQYKQSYWGWGKMFNFFGLSENKKKIDSIAKMTHFIGYKQSSSKIEALSIYLNRIKQGYFPFELNGETSPFTECFDQNTQTKLKKTYSECIDLSIGFLENSFYSEKMKYYLENKYYTIDNFKHELGVILSDQKINDKTQKRSKRLAFLNQLEDPIFNQVLEIIFKKIHTHNGKKMGYPSIDSHKIEGNMKLLEEALERRNTTLGALSAAK